MQVCSLRVLYYPHASRYYCIAAHKVIHTVFYCIAEARFSRRNPSSLLLCVTIRLVLQNDTYSPTFTFLSMVNYSTIKPLNMPIHHTWVLPQRNAERGAKKQHQQHQSRFVSKAFPFHALPQMAGNPVFLSAREKHARSCEMRLDWEQQRRREKKYTNTTKEVTNIIGEYIPQILIGASSSRRLGCAKNKSLDVRHSCRISASDNCTCFPGLALLTSNNLAMISSSVPLSIILLLSCSCSYSSGSLSSFRVPWLIRFHVLSPLFLFSPQILLPLEAPHLLPRLQVQHPPTLRKTELRGRQNKPTELLLQRTSPPRARATSEDEQRARDDTTAAGRSRHAHSAQDTVLWPGLWERRWWAAGYVLGTRAGAPGRCCPDDLSPLPLTENKHWKLL